RGLPRRDGLFVERVLEVPDSALATPAIFNSPGAPGAGAGCWSPSAIWEFSVTRQAHGEPGGWLPSTRHRGIAAGRMTGLLADLAAWTAWASPAEYSHSASQCVPRQR